MEGLEWLCTCCKQQECNKKFITEYLGDCKKIKCLQFIKDDKKIIPPNNFEYVVRSDKS